MKQVTLTHALKQVTDAKDIRLRLTHALKQVSLRELAEGICISRTSIHNFYKGRNSTLRTLEAINDTLNAHGYSDVLVDTSMKFDEGSEVFDVNGNKKDGFHIADKELVKAWREKKLTPNMNDDEKCLAEAVGFHSVDGEDFELHFKPNGILQSINILQNGSLGLIETIYNFNDDGKVIRKVTEEYIPKRK